MANPSLREALDALLRPLEFAAADDFSRAPRVKNLRGTLLRGLEGLLARPLPADLKKGLEESRVRLADAEASEPLEPADLRKLSAALALFKSPELTASLLARPLSVFPGVGAKRADSLAKRDIRTVADLLFHLPVRYDDRRALGQVGDLEVGRRATFVATVKTSGFHVTRARGRPRRMFQAVVSDETGSVTLTWFRAGDAIEPIMTPGTTLLCSGDVTRYRFSKQLVHPDVERVEDEAPDTPDARRGSQAGPPGPQGPEARADELEGLRRVVPEYATPEGVNPRLLRRLIALAVDEYADLLEGHLPGDFLAKRRLPDLATALRIVHGPDYRADIAAFSSFRSKAHECLVLEELYLLELGLLLRREAQVALPGIAIDVDTARARAAADGLPFRLTGAQQRVWQEIRRDLSAPRPMNRLLQGDVGSGKTAVALLAAETVAGGGQQAALMAPTELLAEQHARTLARLTGAAKGPRLRIALLTASVPRVEADAIRLALSRGDIDLVIGTHALLQRGVEFARLALVVVDEQHRFGVLQRAALSEKAADQRLPHVLVMTATPIPRTLALTLYGDLDVSVIDELPPGRSAAETLLLREGEGRRITDLVRQTVDRGEQVYVVYPLVEESEKIDLRSATESAQRIARAFPKLSVDLVHGRQSAEERALAMRRFEANEIQILVSTTVIEVGVDVPMATLMIVEHAERFGLAQLHQLRGRVGRGDRPGTCVLVARRSSEDSEARLRALLETTDGFRIADADLRIRGPGEFLGTRQSGHLPDLRIADLVRDANLVSVAREAAQATLARDPGLRGQPRVHKAVEQRWGERLALVSVA